MKSKNDVLDCFCQFLTDVGIPERLISDGAGEFVKWEEFQEELRQYKIQQHASEPHHQHQNWVAETQVKNVKHMCDYLMNMSGIPDNRWCFVVELAEDLLNLRALKSLGWQNAYQATLGETRDISPYFQLKLCDKVTYTNPGVPFT